jgi:hypothetical protein
MKKSMHTIKLVSFSLLALLGTSFFIGILEVQRTAALS